MTSVVVRTIIVYIILSFSLRMMGKRQLGELDVSELVSTLLISEIASIPIDNPDIPLLNAIIPIFFILALEIILSTIKNKSEKMKALFEGKPQYIIYKGRLLQNMLKENRISINELLSELRSQGVGDIEEVYYAAIEKNGTLSILKKKDSEMAHAVIIDGNIIESNLSANNYTKKKLSRVLSSKGLLPERIFLMTVADSGRINIILKDEVDK
ncbi:MAG: DUF421 domain-containing protein [Clostridia bacterium]|nr:DUF421 domain-containing protein [Clostridia bacterium]